MASILRPSFNTLFRPLSATTGVYRNHAQLLFKSARRSFHSPTPKLNIGVTNLSRQGPLYGRNILIGAATVSLVGLGLALSPKFNMEPTPPAVAVPPATDNSVPPPATTPPVAAPTPASRPPPPKSSVNLYELSFGTVCGICAGVFVKKGAKAVAFFLGGIFVFFQYFTSVGMVKVNWTKLGSSFEKRFHSQPAGPGQPSKPPTVYSLWNWIVDFLTADFPPRATFLAGFVLGLRVG